MMKNYKKFIVLISVFVLLSFSAFASEIKTTHVVLRALDKITGKSSLIIAPVAPKLDSKIDQEKTLQEDGASSYQEAEYDKEGELYKDYVVHFGTLEIMAKACFKTPPEETPENSAFLKISERKPSEKPVKVFSGWMFSSSPALSAIEHSVYDIWVLKCGNEQDAKDYAEAESKRSNLKNAIITNEPDEEISDLDD
ncbi:MAG: DUF2155 domain-containing protein [Alphaproteobacteria bacterium]